MRFEDILASLIHDMKNSLGMVINTLEGLDADLAGAIADRSKITALQHEAKRLNNNLMELLTLYKIENDRIAPNIEELNLGEFLEELAMENLATAEARGTKLSWECDPELNGYFDEGLIRGVINSLIGNGLRYTRGKLLISAGQDEGYLVLRVEDNGAGYPAAMLEAQDVRGSSESLAEGHTQLGIHFAGMVADMHRNRGRSGFVRLTNDHRLGGGCFSIWLP